MKTENIQEEIKEEKVSSFKFDSFGFKDSILKGIQNADFRAPSPIQIKAIPAILSGADIVGQAHTGTGKTAAFGLPVLNMIKNTGSVEVLVITPTRELAGQVSDELFRLGKYANIKTTTVYGGQSYSHQIKNIKSGTHVVVATPGRLLDLLENCKIRSSVFTPSIVILDEADEMLDMGFLDDIQKIFSFLPEDRQTLLFSATMPPPIQKLAKVILKDPKFISVTNRETTNKNIEQHYYVIEERERDDAIIRLMNSQDPGKSIIFCRMKKEVDRICTLLVTRGYTAKGLHGDMEQSQREEVIQSFRDGKIDTLIATDVAARGLDVLDVTHVFNYHIPFDPESYVHRIGRTARAGRKGVAITLVTPLEFKDLKRIQRLVGTNIQKSKIPTGSEVRKAYVSNLLYEIQAQGIKEEAKEIMEALEEEMDLSLIAYKLVSYLLDKQEVVGPDQIGISERQLKKILYFQNKNQMNKRKFSNNRKKRPFNKKRINN